MGIDISGGMIVGSEAENISYDEEQYEEVWEFADAHNLSCYSKWYDAGSEGQVLGFTVDDVDPLSPEFESWVKDVKDKAHKFYQLTGIKAELIGMQNVW